jgi:hypothetical protein
MYTHYRLALIINEEMRQRAEQQRLVTSLRGESRFVKVIQKFFAKPQPQKPGKYGLQ